MHWRLSKISWYPNLTSNLTLHPLAPSPPSPSPPLHRAPLALCPAHGVCSSLCTAHPPARLSTPPLLLPLLRPLLPSFPCLPLHLPSAILRVAAGRPPPRPRIVPSQRARGRGVNGPHEPPVCASIVPPLLPPLACACARTVLDVAPSGRHAWYCLAAPLLLLLLLLFAALIACLY